MPFSYKDLSVRGRDGRRVAIANCKLEPLNLLIPGSAPIVVPKKNAWRSPSQQIQTANRNKKLDLEITQDSFEADSDEEEEDDEEEDESHDEDTQPLIQKPQPRDKNPKEKCRKDSIKKEGASEAKHRRKAEHYQKKAELEHDRLQKRIAKQEAYIAKLKARYGGAAKEDAAKHGTRRNKLPRSTKKRAAAAADDTEDDGATTDGSAAVRAMLNNMKIRAGGKESPRFFAQPGDQPWTVSDDSQLIALKNGSDGSYAVIGECMGRRAGEVKRRYKYLKDCGFTIPGENETTEAEKTGEETTDVENAGAETTDAEKTEDEVKVGEGADTMSMDAEKPTEGNTGGEGDCNWSEEADTQLWKLKAEGKTWAEIHAIMGGSKSSTKDRYKHLKRIDFKPPNESTDVDQAGQETADAAKPDEGGNGDDNDANKQADEEPTTSAPKSDNHRGDDKTSSSPPHHIPDRCVHHDDGGGTRAYIAQYARNLLAQANAGRARIPEPDEIFDEDDCFLLALADSRRRENRWLDIQADYFNVTGRMVPLEVLRWKLGGGEQPANEF